MIDERENGPDPADEPGGTLADAIAEHMALKREHGGDPERIEHELEEALAPPRRDEPLPQAAEPAQEPPPAEPAPAEPAPPDPAPPEPASPEPAPPEPEPEPQIDPDPISEEEIAASVDEPRPGEITGTIEFEFGDQEQPAGEPESNPQPASGHDLLEDTPDFFEETPEHDKLWFDEAPPRKFDF